MVYTISEKAIRFRHPDYIIQIGLKSYSKVNQFVHVPTSVDTQHFIQIHARVFSNIANRQTDRQTRVTTIGINFLQIVGGGLMALSFLSLPLPSPPFPSPPLSLEVGPPNPARESGGAL